MDLKTLAETLHGFVTNHPYVTGGVLAIAGLMAYNKFRGLTKALRPWLVAGLVAYFILYVAYLAFSPSDEPEKASRQTTSQNASR